MGTYPPRVFCGVADLLVAHTENMLADARVLGRLGSRQLLAAISAEKKTCEFAERVLLAVGWGVEQQLCQVAGGRGATE